MGVRCVKCAGSVGQATIIDLNTKRQVCLPCMVKGILNKPKPEPPIVPTIAGRFLKDYCGYQPQEVSGE